MSDTKAGQLPPVLRPENPPKRSLAALAEHFQLHSNSPLEGAVRGVTNSTADLRPGEIFAAMKGFNRHGAEVATKAQEIGALAILTDPEGAALIAEADEVRIPVLITENPRGVLGDLAAWVYQTSPSDQLPLLFATTGTNGKTSTTHILDSLFKQLGVTSGLSSTAERHIAGQVIVSRLTTPEASEFHALLALMRERDVEAVGVEVSAQALSRNRVDGIVFDVAGFTNLSHDHLDDYADFQEYLEAKLPLFQPERAKRGVVSLDSSYGKDIAGRAGIPIVTICTPAIADDPAEAQDADWVVNILQEEQTGTTFELTDGQLRTLKAKVTAIGPHMAANTGLAIVMLLEAGYDWETLQAAIGQNSTLKAYIPGRTELVSGAVGPAVYVDFGHTPDAFEKTLAAVRRVTPGKVLMLFGADGDRDPSKRFDMARTAVEGSDILVITDHHPRFEDAASIRNTLVSAAREVQPDAEIYEYSPPETAIVEAVKLVGTGDAILWAGPGHQDYRDIRGVRTPYSARELARRALKGQGWEVPDSNWVVPYPPEDD